MTDPLRRWMMSDTLRDRITDALVQALRSQADLGGGFIEYECDDDALLSIDAVVDPRIVADAVIDLLIDMAGHGELLKSIDRMHRD